MADDSPGGGPPATARRDGDGLRILQFLSRADFMKEVQPPDLNYVTELPPEVPRPPSASQRPASGGSRRQTAAAAARPMSAHQPTASPHATAHIIAASTARARPVSARADFSRSSEAATAAAAAATAAAAAAAAQVAAAQYGCGPAAAAPSAGPGGCSSHHHSVGAEKVGAATAPPGAAAVPAAAAAAPPPPPPPPPPQASRLGGAQYQPVMRAWGQWSVHNDSYPSARRRANPHAPLPAARRRYDVADMHAALLRRSRPSTALVQAAAVARLARALRARLRPAQL